jgi:DNA-directed RNA polymerase specialized sigma24 family protein
MSDQDKSGFAMPFIEKLRAGDNEAWALFYQKYERRVRAYIARRISWPAARQDDEDVWLSLIGSLVRRLQSDKEQLAIEKMTAFVMGMAKHKWLAEYAKQHASKRNPTKELADGSAVNQVQQSGPTPSQIAMAREEYDRFMNRLDPMDCKILELELQGYSTKEIAEKMERSQRTIQLRLEKIDYLFVVGGNEGPTHDA